MKEVFVFVGPTLSVEVARRQLDAVYLPPVSQGDVYRAARRRPRAIGIIDGYFERMPSVWHKEILWAMAHGIHVFGSASMGAIRAAELDMFGMEGIGVIFDAFNSGDLEDDDEVAVGHGPQEMGYPATSEAMVNIRRTFKEAELTGIIAPETHKSLLSIAKQLCYQERNYALILQRAAEEGIPETKLEALGHWLPHGQVDQKREDAVAMLCLIRDRLKAGLKPKRVQYTFEHTDVWNYAVRTAGELIVDGDARADVFLLDELFDELRLEGEPYKLARQAAMARVLAIEESTRQDMDVTAEALRKTAETFRRRHGLVEPEDVKRWMDEQHLSRDHFNRLMLEETRLRRMNDAIERDVMDSMPDHLRATGDYGRLLERARNKRSALAALGLENPSLEDIGLTEEAVWRWYFEKRLGQSVPDDLDSYAQSIDFADKSALLRAVLREYYCTQKPGKVA